ncbi:MAG: hypothetical protein P4L99_27915 [Chthoniobacter sp.]|nr:hypothetical protein [Chthoniobacter sp.]
MNASLNNATAEPAPKTASPVDDFITEMQRIWTERRAAAEIARPALARLCEVLKDRSGQPYKLRALLWSLYNGKPASLLEIVCLDWQIRQDLCAVLLAFGFEGNPRAFFYAEIKSAITEAGQWTWFVEESEVEA